MIAGACAVIGLICGFAIARIIDCHKWEIVQVDGQTVARGTGRAPAFGWTEPPTGPAPEPPKASERIRPISRDVSFSAGRGCCNHHWKLTRGRECMKCGDMCRETDFADDSEAVREEWGGHLPGEGTGITFDPAGVSIDMEALLGDGLEISLDDSIGEEDEPVYPPPTPEEIAENERQQAEWHRQGREISVTSDDLRSDSLDSLSEVSRRLAESMAAKTLADMCGESVPAAMPSPVPDFRQITAEECGIYPSDSAGVTR